MEVFDSFTDAHPLIDLDVFFDDIEVPTTGTTKKVHENLAAASTALLDVSKNDLKGNLALDNGTVTSSSGTLAINLRRAMGERGGGQTGLSGSTPRS